MEHHTAPATTSAVQTVVETPAEAGPSTSQPAAHGPPAEHLVLRLVPKKKKKKQSGQVQWTDDTVDNELMERKKSKKCCIFHKQKPFGDWSDNEDSDSECGACKENQDQGPPPPPPE